MPEASNVFAHDEAAYHDTVPWLTPNGHITQNPACSWTSGYVYIDNPFGWAAPGANKHDPPHKVFATDTKDEILLTAEGLVGVRKLFNQVTRTTNDVIHVNGRRIQ